MNPGSADQVLVDTFEEVALVLGGIFAVHEVDDEAVWQAAKSLSVIYRKARAAIRNACAGAPSEPDERGAEPHPAIVDLLAELRRDRKAPRHEEVGSR